MKGIGKSKYKVLGLVGALVGVLVFVLVLEISEPAITVMSPEEGEKWVIGKTYDIMWESEGLQEVDIYFVRPWREDELGMVKPSCTRIVTGIPAATGIYIWVVSDDTAPQEEVSIAIVRAGFHPHAGWPERPPNGFVIGYSSPFRIVCRGDVTENVWVVSDPVIDNQCCR